MEMLRARPFDRLLLAGPEEARTVLRRELPSPLRSRYAGSLPVEANATDPVLREAVIEAAEAVERQAEVTAVNDLLEAAPGQTALGLVPVLAALSEHRVHQLLLADTFAGTVAECPQCHRLVDGTDRCAMCSAQPLPLPDPRERLVDRALEQGARVKMLSGEAAARLLAHDGIGAWTRY